MNTLERIQTQRNGARVLRNSMEVDVLGTLLGELTRNTKIPTEDEVQKGIKKFLKNLQITLDHQIKVDSPDINKTKHEYAIVSDYQTMKQLCEETDIFPIIQKLIAGNSDKWESCKTKPGNIGWFVGNVMKETGGKANPATVKSDLERLL